ncbi:hypothetical protein [Streptomyces phaeoluteigriseus]
MAVLVRRLRVSFLSVRVHDKVKDSLGLPGAFMRCLRELQPIEGLYLELPFPTPVDQDDVEWLFWSKITERKGLRPPAALGQANQEDRKEARRLWRAAMPLRYQAEIVAPSFQTPRLEAFLHPFGWVTISTADLAWDPPVALGDAVVALNNQQGSSADVIMRLGDGSSSDLAKTATVATASDVLTNLLSDRLATDQTSPMEGHRLVTIIDGRIDGLRSMPGQSGPLFKALHRMTVTNGQTPHPKDAFVARWDFTGRFGWIPTELIYMLGPGTSVVLTDAVNNRPPVRAESTAGKHRQLALLISYLLATSGLIKSRAPDSPPDLEPLAKVACGRLTRLFLPDPPGAQYWGLEAQAYLEKTGTIPAIEAGRSRWGLNPPTVTPRYAPPGSYP